MNGKLYRLSATAPVEPEREREPHLDELRRLALGADAGFAAKLAAAERELVQARAQEAQERRLAATRRYRR